MRLRNQIRSKNPAVSDHDQEREGEKENKNNAACICLEHSAEDLASRVTPPPPTTTLPKTPRALLVVT